MVDAVPAPAKDGAKSISAAMLRHVRDVRNGVAALAQPTNAVEPPVSIHVLARGLAEAVPWLGENGRRYAGRGLSIVRCFYKSRFMKMNDAILALGALAHETRLATFRLLVRAGPAGLPAGEIAGRLKVAPPVMSFHLADLAKAGLVASRREGRSIIYAARYKRIGALLDFLIEDCCQGACGTRDSATKETIHETLAR